ncbi:MAG: glycosyl transferase [Deltaproteobacteria bacterium RIFCSPLOWO2_12_FULL_57_22]|nr:MAG: glycosyl transferase [Deltaproteobacteria bacterium RIFCSPLOWO2_12_FULL_57_22]
MKLSVVMPVFNEVGTLEEALGRVRNVRLPKEIIVVDDGSTDGSRDLLNRLRTQIRPQDDVQNELKVIFQPFNQGKGAAIRSALSSMTGDIVIIQDADLEYDPQDYTKLLDPILAGKADVVYGTRFYGGGAHRVLFFWHYLGNQALTFFSNMLTNLNLSDMEVGYKVFRTEVLKSIDIESQRFGFEVEVTVKVAKKKYRIYEVPISYYGRTYAEGKKITWKDGFAAFYFLVRFWLKG